MGNACPLFLLSLLSCAIPQGRGAGAFQILPSFQTSPQILTLDPISRQDIRQRLGLTQSDPTDANVLSIGSGPNMGYALKDEYEVLDAVSGTHQGILCAAELSGAVDGDVAGSIANHRELVSQVILSGSLAASIRNRCEGVNSMYYLPYVITLVESLMVDEMKGFDFGRTLFNSGGLETNEVLLDPNDDGEGSSVILYAQNTQEDKVSATSDVYVLPITKGGKVWRFTIEYKVAAINLRQILSFGKRDSTTPLQPDVWLKDDY